MPAGYRTALISIGVFLALGGAVGTIGALTAHATAFEHIRSFGGGVFATVCGVVVVQSALRGRAPNWVARLFGIKRDDEDDD